MCSTSIQIKIKELLKAATVIDGHCDIIIPLTEKKMVISDKVELPESSNWEVPEDIKNHAYRQYGFNAQTIYFGCAGQ